MKLKNTFISIFAVSLSMAIAGSAGAATEFNKSIDNLGIQKSGSVGYFSTTDAGGVESCTAGRVHFDMSSDFGKSAFSYLLAGRVASKKIRRFEYSAAPDGTCNLESLEMDR